MNREQFEQLLAEALGEELSHQDRAKFEAALAEHANWKREYEDARRAVETLGELSAPKRMLARREGDALVIEPARATHGVRRAGATGGRWRYAAAILIAFTAGYAVHATLVMQQAFRSQGTMVQKDRETGRGTQDVERESSDGASTRSLEAALVGVHTRRPSSSTLAKCMIAVAARH